MKKYIIKVNGASYEVEVEEVAGGSGAQATTVAAQAAPVPAPAPAPVPVAPAPVSTAPAPAPAPSQAAAASAAAPPAGATSVTAPMPGTIIRVVVNVGDTVKRSQPVILLEAMKMENEIVSPSDGKVLAIHTSQGASVNTGDLLVSIG